MTKHLVVILTLSLIVGGISVPGAFTQETLDVFIMAGQSNMQGWMGDAVEYPEDTQKLDELIHFYWVTPGYSSSLGAWTRMQAQGGRFSAGHFGPEVTFGRALTANGYHPAIFKYSLGATGIAEDWRWPGLGGLYDRMVKEYKQALTLLQQEGYTVRPRAFIWIQGENDSENPYLAGRYYARLCSLVVDVRANMTGEPQLPVLLGVDEEFPLEDIKTVVEAQKKFADTDSFAVWTAMTGLEKADFTHLTPAGLEAHGKRLYDAFLLLEKRDPVEVKPMSWRKVKELIR